MEIPISFPRSPLLRLLAWTTAVGTVLALGYFRIVTEAEYALSSAVLIPLVAITWLEGRHGGLVLAVASTLVLAIADHASGRMLPGAGVLLINGLTRLVTYSFLAIVVAKLNILLRQEREFATHDFLTGLLNRRAMLAAGEAEARRALRYGNALAVAFVDLDNFKQVNDCHGHASGDRLLHAVAVAMQRSLRASDHVARVGGDEFAVILPELDEHAATAAADKIRSAIDLATTPFPGVSASIGVVVADAPPITFEAMLKQADELMYEIKAEGKSHVRVRRYQPTPAA